VLYNKDKHFKQIAYNIKCYSKTGTNFKTGAYVKVTLNQ